MAAKRARFEAKMERRRLKWQSRAYRRQNPFGGLLVGLILAGIGVVLLLQNLGILYFDDLWEYWPVILIVVGGSRLVSAWDTGGRIFGGMMLFIGGVFLLHNLGLLRGNVLAYFWPVVLIAIGLALLVRALEGNRAWDLWSDSSRNSSTPPAGGPSTGPGSPRQESWFSATDTKDARNTFSEDHIFSGAKRRLETQDFQGGEALAVFGGIEIDLRKSNITRDQVMIEANAMFGGIEIKVPEHWRVLVRGSGIFGGYSDETVQPVGGDTKHPELIITGTAVFGGVNVKN